MHERELKRIYDAYSRKLYNYVLWMTHDRSAGQDMERRHHCKSDGKPDAKRRDVERSRSVADDRRSDLQGYNNRTAGQPSKYLCRCCKV